MQIIEIIYQVFVHVLITGFVLVWLCLFIFIFWRLRKDADN